MITESMVRGNPKEAADIIATLEQEVAALEAREAALVKALEAFTGDKLPSLRKTEIDFDRYGLRRLMSPMEIACTKARSLISAQEGK